MKNCRILFLLFITQYVHAQSQLLQKSMQHFRKSNYPEWTSFAKKPKKQLYLEFASNQQFKTLAITQQDVRRSWVIEINGRTIGKLIDDENKFVSYYAIPANTLKLKNNHLIIRQTDTATDDILIGDISMMKNGIPSLVQQATIAVSVSDKNAQSNIPARITIVNSGGALQPVGAFSDDQLAVRTGCVYTANGLASFGVPAGKYTLFATRGFEYGVDSFTINIRPGERQEHSFTIAKEVPTEGWISCDPHIHTYTHSGHGDATAQERVITIAGEGIEFPIITDHNMAIHLDSIAKRIHLDSFFTLVTGNEFTTPVGHFNVFPVEASSIIPDAGVKDWKEVAETLGSREDKVIMLNHARDAHQHFRPFGAERHMQSTGKDLQGWEFPANAMEVVNSGSQQQDIMQLYKDWFGMMQYNHKITPAGSSDSHDVFRNLVGQSRTYIRYDGNEDSRILSQPAIENFINGKVSVSFGLMVEVVIDKLYMAGDLVPIADEVVVEAQVSGPSWVKGDRVTLYVNGIVSREEEIQSDTAGIFRWSGYWIVPVHLEDLFVVVVAQGPDPKVPFWPIAHPFQRSSANWRPSVIGSSGAIWVDADGNGMITTAFDYAKEMIESSNGDLKAMMHELNMYSEMVSTQAAIILQKQGVLKAAIEEALKMAYPPVKKAFRLIYK